MLNLNVNFPFVICTFLSGFQGELEKLNQSTDDINRCETELEVSHKYSIYAHSVSQFYISVQHLIRSAPLSLLTFDLRHCRDP